MGGRQLGGFVERPTRQRCFARVSYISAVWLKVFPRKSSNAATRESVVATIKFKVLSRYPVRPGPWQEGKMELLVEWRQTSINQDIVDCKMRKGFYQYHYEQKNLTTPIQVIARDSSTNPPAIK